MDKKLILFFGVTDDANTTYRWSQALNAHSDKYQARVVVLQAHPFGYDEDIVWNPQDEEQTALVHSLFKECALFSMSCLNEIVHSFLIPTDVVYYNMPVQYQTLGKLIKNKPKMVRHHGTFYRHNWMRADRIDLEAKIDARFIGPDLMRFATAGEYAHSPNTQWQYPYLHCILDNNGVTQSDLKPLGKKTPVVMHIPSNTGKKGTARIRAAMERIGSNFDYVEITGVSAQEALEAKQNCDIYIDQVEPYIGGYGASTTEALSFGKAVVASINHVWDAREDIAKHWPLPPVVMAHDEDELVQQLGLLLDPKNLLETQQESLKWYENYGSPKAIAQWLDGVFDEVITNYK